MTMQIGAPREMISWDRVLVIAGVVVGLGCGAFLFRTSAPASPQPRRDEAKESAGAIGPPSSDLAALQQERDELERRVAELEVSRLKQRLASLESDNAPTPVVPRPLQAANPDYASVDNHEPSRSSAPTATKRNPGEKSLAFWNSLNDVMVREAAMRKPPTQITAENAATFLSARGTAGRFACDAIRKLDRTDVDPEVLALSQEIATWYERGVALNERGGELLDSADTARRGTPGQSWRNGEELHRKQCEEINRRGAQLRTRMSRKYSLSFPELQ